MTAQNSTEKTTGELVSHYGIVTLRQRPETAKGTIFLALEDEAV
ncbi:hypothetical protein J2W32_005764 [Variovorax boronicumulans]|uniref:Uncharacterized protein n=1 Tax=Variovorax boronicumulans TaxID=436515 RepID=A0AAW8D802_9BURK|nr:hypothetical protein [Variovorax boronicumulans]MDP9896654.1 hypothetical protein [Variovorax boronicumulans]MDQ0056695.1 hypothetical protein [Variovorax boronicumulans]